jgi:hypothetical protein
MNEETTYRDGSAVQVGDQVRCLLRDRKKFVRVVRLGKGHDGVRRVVIKSEHARQGTYLHPDFFREHYVKVEALSPEAKS